MKVMGLDQHPNNHSERSHGRRGRPDTGQHHPEDGQRSRRSRLRRWLPAAHGIPHLLPWSRGIGRVSAATKLVCLVALSTVLLLKPQWTAVGVVAAVLLIGSLSARLPISALPALPSWLWAGMMGGMLGAWLGGGLWIFVRSLAVAGIVTWGSFLLLWTTRLDDIAPAFRTLLAPLRLVRVPVDQWTQAMSFAFRGLGPMQDQTSSVVDATKLRLGSLENMESVTLKGSAKIMLDVATASLSAASRRASDTGRALSLRGGIPVAQLAADSPHFGWRDVLTLLVTTGACVTPFVTEQVKAAWLMMTGLF